MLISVLFRHELNGYYRIDARKCGCETNVKDLCGVSFLLSPSYA